MSKHFNLSRYKELLKQEKNGKISFLDENFYELLSSRTSISHQISYNRRKDYFVLIHQYLHKSISHYEFRPKFLQMKKDDSKKSIIIRQDFQKLEVFTIFQNIDKFSKLMGEISTLCFDFDEPWD